jgi:alkylhydroperoxidase family enzyme
LAAVSLTGEWETFSAVADPRALLTPEVDVTLDRLNEQIWDVVDPTIVELARLRIAMLLGNQAELARRPPQAPALAEEKFAALSSWPTSPLFSEIERACLGLTEQFVIDVAGVSDADVTAVSTHFDPAQLYGFVNALYILDYSQRLQLASDRLFGTDRTDS